VGVGVGVWVCGCVGVCVCVCVCVCPVLCECVCVCVCVCETFVTLECVRACVAFAIASERRSVGVALVAVAGRRCTYTVCTSMAWSPWSESRGENARGL
jgi:hypothetical protein